MNECLLMIFFGSTFGCLYTHRVLCHKGLLRHSATSTTRGSITAFVDVRLPGRVAGRQVSKWSTPRGCDRGTFGYRPDLVRSTETNATPAGAMQSGKACWKTFRGGSRAKHLPIIGSRAKMKQASPPSLRTSYERIIPIVPRRSLEA